MTDDTARLLFRMNHIIPRSLSSTPLSLNVKTKSNNGEIDSSRIPEEAEFQMTWGKIGGKSK